MHSGRVHQVSITEQWRVATEYQKSNRLSSEQMADKLEMKSGGVYRLRKMREQAFLQSEWDLLIQLTTTMSLEEWGSLIPESKKETCDFDGCTTRFIKWSWNAKYCLKHRR